MEERVSLISPRPLESPGSSPSGQQKEQVLSHPPRLNAESPSGDGLGLFLFKTQVHSTFKTSSRANARQERQCPEETGREALKVWGTRPSKWAKHAWLGQPLCQLLWVKVLAYLTPG